MKVLLKFFKFCFKNFVCPKCSNVMIVKHGFRKNKKFLVQRYSCKNCNKRFSKNVYNYRMRNSEDLIKKAINFRKEKFSYEQIAKKLNNEVSRQTIFHWIKKYK